MKLIAPAGIAVMLSLMLAGCGANSDGFLAQNTLVPLGGRPDGVPPTVLATRPAATNTAVKINAVIGADFSEYVNASTLTETTFLLRDASGNAIQGSVMCSGMSATFTPAVYLLPNTVYTASITRGVADASGTNMAGDYTWSFTTRSSTDVVSPLIASRSPAVDEHEVKVNTAVTVTFDEPIEPTSCTSNAIALIYRYTKDQIAGTVTCGENSVVFTPTQALSQKTGYSACIQSPISDLEGNVLADGPCWEFWTGYVNMEMFTPYTAFAIGAYPEAVAIGDVTGDGKNDIVVVTGYDNNTPNGYKLILFAQDSSGGLLSAITYSTTNSSGSRPMSVAVGDINNDGKNEVVIANIQKNMVVFEQDGLGGLVSSAVYTSVQGYKLKIADLNNDGRFDVVNFNGNVLSLMYQNSSGTLDPPITYTIGSSLHYYDFDIGDVNNDGLPDIIAVSDLTENHHIAVLIQNQGGTFNPAVFYDTHGSTLRIGDMTNDGLNDIITISNGNICVLTQNSLGTLDPAVCYPTYYSPSAITIADVDQDGRKDIIATTGGYYTVGIYLQTVAGLLSPADLYSSAYGLSSTESLAVADINSDGRNDIVTIDPHEGLIVLYHK